MNGASPTRMNLLTRRSQLKLAKRGVDLLEKKRDALVQEFFANVHQALEARRHLNEVAQEAHWALILAKSFDGPETVEALSLTAPVRFKARAEVDNIWGTKVPRLAADHSEAVSMSPLGVGSRTVAAQATFRELSEVLLQVANTEARLRRVAGEIRKTARRVNALQQAVIPGIRSQIRAVQQALDQQEQEDIFRLKRIKGKIAGKIP